MIDPTNSLASPDTAHAVQSTLNAWHLVALGAGASIVHAYHTIVNAGGVRQIWSNFWNGQKDPAK